MNVETAVANGGVTQGKIKMKIQIMSDLHLEFGHMHKPPAVGDVLVLAGDVGVVKKWSTIEMIEAWAEDFEQVIYVPGNHEYYKGGDIEVSKRNLMLWADGTDNIRVLDKDVYHFDGVVFIGATLWSNLMDTEDAAIAKLWMNDFRYIRMNNYAQPISTAKWTEMHVSAAKYLRDAMKLWTGMKKVVVTHYLPSFKSTHPDFTGNALNPAFASNLDNDIEIGRPELWIHGHTHRSMDYKLHDTRIICNPRGYVGHEMNEDFDKTLTVEI